MSKNQDRSARIRLSLFLRNNPDLVKKINASEGNLSDELINEVRERYINFFNNYNSNEHDPYDNQVYSKYAQGQQNISGYYFAEQELKDVAKLTEELEENPKVSNKNTIDPKLAEKSKRNIEERIGYLRIDKFRKLSQEEKELMNLSKMGKLSDKQKEKYGKLLFELREQLGEKFSSLQKTSVEAVEALEAMDAVEKRIVKLNQTTAEDKISANTPSKKKTHHRTTQEQDEIDAEVFAGLTDILKKRREQNKDWYFILPHDQENYERLYKKFNNENIEKDKETVDPEGIEIEIDEVSEETLSQHSSVDDNGLGNTSEYTKKSANHNSPETKETSEEEELKRDLNQDNEGFNKGGERRNYPHLLYPGLKAARKIESDEHTQENVNETRSTDGTSIDGHEVVDRQPGTTIRSPGLLQKLFNRFFGKGSKD